MDRLVADLHLMAKPIDRERTNREMDMDILV